MSDKNNNNKRKDSGQYIETRNRKKAREALDLITNSKQRHQSVLNLLGSEYTGPSESQLEMIFRLFDRNRDGKIDGDELKDVLRAMNKRPLTRRIDKILAECDADGNGYIEMDEFVRYMQKKAAEKAKQLGLLESDDEEEETIVDDAEAGDTDEEKEDTPKRKAAGARPKRKAASTPSAATTSTNTTTTPSKSITKQPSFFAPLKKGSSIIQYYTENAGTHQQTNIQLDKYNNPSGLEHDLGLEGAFTQFTILVGKFYNFTSTDCDNALKSKGFSIIESTTQKDFIAQLQKADVALIISNYQSDNTSSEQEFVDAVKQFHESGKGIFIFNDNKPYICQGNWVSKALFNVESDGSELGKKELTLGKGDCKQQFGSHLITTGINNLYEGVTISSFAKKSDKLDALATSSEGNTIILVSNDNYSKSNPNCGRVLLDTGFTKLFADYYSAGTDRYIRNACVWLLSLDNRFSLGVELTGSIPKPIETPVWQFEHGGWHDYDFDASKIVEDTYQEYLLNPHIDVRSVKSGLWAYQIDFKQLTQTNIQHFNHTSRNIRRIMKQVVQPQV